MTTKQKPTAEQLESQLRKVDRWWRVLAQVRADKAAGVKMRNGDIADFRRQLENLCNEGPDESAVAQADRNRNNERRLRTIQATHRHLGDLEDAKAAYIEEMTAKISEAEQNLGKAITSNQLDLPGTEEVAP